MALTYCVLASGSSGNALWVRGGGVEVLVDCGLSARALGHRLSDVGGSLQNIQAVFCTHGHGDHVSGAAVLARKHHLDIHATEGTHGHISRRTPLERRRTLPRQGTVALGGLTVRTVPTSHDAPGSVGLVLSDGETSLGIVTDTGVPTRAVLEAFAGVDGLVLEMNHDEDMLLNGPYPARLKARIKGERGHLSNAQAADVLARLATSDLQHVTLAHLSEHNNTPGLARGAAEAALEAHRHPALEVASQHLAGVPVSLRARRQLGLPLWT